jgi:hypothetical protein
MRKVVPIVLLVAALAAGCGGTQPLAPADGGSNDSADATDPTDAALDGDGAIGCDPSLTYANFGKAFLDTYCFRCHGFDQQSAQTSGSAIVGAAGTGTFMPPVDPRPSDQERQQLTAWIACGAP